MIFNLTYSDILLHSAINQNSEPSVEGRVANVVDFLGAANVGINKSWGIREKRIWMG